MTPRPAGCVEPFFAFGFDSRFGTQVWWVRAAGEVLSEDRRRADLDRERSARQTSEVDRAEKGAPPPDDHGGVSPECHEDLLERVVLGAVELDLQRGMSIWGVFLGRIRAGRGASNGRGRGASCSASGVGGANRARVTS